MATTETPAAIRDVLESVNCPICHGSEFEVTLPAAYPGSISREELLRMYSSSSEQPLLDQMVRCRSCAMQYVTPRVRSDIILESYRNAKDETHWDQAARRVKSFRDSFSIVMKKLSLAPSRNIRILDIGSAGGYFVKAAADIGFTATGIEPSVWLSETGRRSFGIDLRTGSLEDTHFNPQSFELVSLWDVIEHVPDPSDLLDKIHPLITSRGHLAISIPDYGSLAARILGRRWPFLLNVHLYYFTRQTVQRLLEAHGFRVLFFRPYFQTLEAGYVLRRAVGILPGLSPFQTALRWLHAEHLPIRYHVGQTILVAQKI